MILLEGKKEIFHVHVAKNVHRAYEYLYFSIFGHDKEKYTNYVRSPPFSLPFASFIIVQWLVRLSKL